MQLSIIQITNNGSDEAVVLNGNIICTADPTCSDSLELISAVANNLQSTLQTPLSYIEVSPDEDWQWEDVIQNLKTENKLISQTDNSTVVLDTVIKDWRLSESEDISHVPIKDRCEYALRIEKDMPAEKVWVSVYNKAFDNHGDAIYKSGLHCSIEIRDGVPALSVGISPDENVIHVLSNTSNELAVIPEQNDSKPTWLPVDFIEAKHLGYCFPVDDYEVLMEARSELANECFGNFDFGEKLVVDDSGWEIDDSVWQKSVFFEDEQGSNPSNGKFELTFTENGTHIISAKEL